MENQITTKLNKNQIDELTKEILELKESTAKNIIEIGKRLSIIKGQIGHGNWGNWLEKTVDFTQQTANKFMKISEEFSNYKATFNLGTEKLYLLTGLKKENREEFLQNNDVENMSTRELKQAIKDMKKAHKKVTEDIKTDSNIITSVEFEVVTEPIEAIKDDNLDDAINEYEQLKEKINQQEVKIKELKEKELMNKKYKDDMSVEFEEVIKQGIFGGSVLMYNIYFCKGKTKTKINPEEYSATWFKDIDITDRSDIMVHYVNNVKTLIQEEKDFVLGECLKFVEQALRRYEEVLETSSRKYEEDIFNEAFAELSKTQTNNKNKEAYKKFYKTLSKKYHPDHGGTNEEMSLVNQLKLQWGV